MVRQCDHNAGNGRTISQHLGGWCCGRSGVRGRRRLGAACLGLHRGFAAGEGAGLELGNVCEFVLKKAAPARVLGLVLARSHHDVIAYRERIGAKIGGPFVSGAIGMDSHGAGVDAQVLLRIRTRAFWQWLPFAKPFPGEGGRLDVLAEQVGLHQWGEHNALPTRTRHW